MFLLWPCFYHGPYVTIFGAYAFMLLVSVMLLYVVPDSPSVQIVSRDIMSRFRLRRDIMSRFRSRRDIMSKAVTA